MAKFSFIPYAKQTIEQEDIESVMNALKEDAITRGPPVKAFEEAIANDCNVRYAVAFTNGTAALMAAYFAAELQPYDYVISSPNTFIATVGIPLQQKLPIHFTDIDRETGNLDLSQIKKMSSIQLSRGRFIIVPVHFSGLAVDMQALDYLICQPNAVVIEDAAHAIGSFYPSGEKVGSCVYSNMTIFSFHPTKTITTGEGGMVTTNDPGLYHRLLLFRDNGIERENPYLLNAQMPGYYEVHAITGNFNVTSLQGALGLSQLKRLKAFVEKRRLLIQHYRQALKEFLHFKLFTDSQDDITAFHLFVIQIDFEAYQTTRESVMEKLKQQGIGTQVHYIPLYRHPIFKSRNQVFKSRNQDWQSLFPNMEAYYKQTLTLPLYPELTTKDVDRICETLKSILK
ncbi:DegT/DnrJ/EryC1/StrS family aminotransferase [Candidatus Protochlamydia sp. W-9]|uniref:DegT/DnrJ/EryC1/StrS family aminotransferase n=1 Tax=Candidatus Protochlamydia sp. W-9 TaxID=1785087 RepID=UPI00096A627C|nr:DegT/DnrJ/EryC1/StrS family aminotransferase [Candidatus Protochlamydia sp. W-9]